MLYEDKSQVEKARSFARRNKNRTIKITGFLMAILGALQAAIPQLMTLLATRTFAIFVVGLGVAIAMLGFINAQLASDSQEE